MSRATPTAAAPASTPATSVVPKARQSAPRSTLPRRLLRSRKWSAVFTNAPIDEPSAIPGAPSHLMNSQARPVETTSENAAIFTGVRVSRMA